MCEPSIALSACQVVSLITRYSNESVQWLCSCHHDCYFAVEIPLPHHTTWIRAFFEFSMDQPSRPYLNHIQSYHCLSITFFYFFLIPPSLLQGSYPSWVSYHLFSATILTAVFLWWVSLVVFLFYQTFSMPPFLRHQEEIFVLDFEGSLSDLVSVSTRSEVVQYCHS